MIVGSLRDFIVNGDIESIRCFIAANPTLPSEKYPTGDKMTLIMLAARSGELLFTIAHNGKIRYIVKCFCPYVFACLYVLDLAVCTFPNLLM